MRSLAVSNRRRLLRAIVAATLAGGASALAQPAGRTWRVGFLSPRRRPAVLDADYYGAFPRRMRELGYVEGRNFVIEWRFADGVYDRLDTMAAELVRAKVDAILALGPPGVAAAQKATATIPIVMVVSVDPVAAGFVRSLGRPGGNITGIANLGTELAGKHVEMLVQIVPKLSAVAMLGNPASLAHPALVANAQAAAQRARIALVALEATTPEAIEQAFAAAERERVGAMIVALDPLFIQQRTQITALALRRRLPSIYAIREDAEAGGLLSYGQNQVDIYERAAGYVDRILRGARPATLPVEQPTKLELVVNLATARSLGLVVPQALAARADRLVE